MVVRRGQAHRGSSRRPLQVAMASVARPVALWRYCAPPWRP